MCSEPRSEDVLLLELIKSNHALFNRKQFCKKELHVSQDCKRS